MIYEIGTETGYGDALDYKIIDGETDVEVEENDIGISDVYYTDEYESDTIQCEEYRCESFFEVKENIYMDKDSGNLYMVESSVHEEMKFFKYDKNGQLIWEKRAEGGGGCVELEYIDKDENFYISRRLYECIPKSTCSCGVKYVISKYEMYENIYKEVWYFSVNGDYEGESIESISVDSDENVYVSGEFVNIIDFGDGKVLHSKSKECISQGPYGWKCFKDVFVVKFDKDGNVVWAKGIGGEGDDSAWNGYISDDGLILEVSSSSESIYIDDKKLTVENNGIMIIKLDRDGEYKWSKFSALGYEYMKGIDKEGNIYFYGYYDSMNNENKDLFLVKYNKNGELVWSKKVEIREIQSGYELLGKPVLFDLYIDKYQNIYTLGDFAIISTTDFSYIDYSFLSKYNQKGDRFWYKDIIESRFFGLERISGIVNGDIYLVLISYNRNPVTIDNCSINDISEDLSYKYYLLKFTPEGCSSVEADK